MSGKDSEVRVGRLFSPSFSKHLLSIAVSQALCWAPGHGVSEVGIVLALYELEAWWGGQTLQRNNLCDNDVIIIKMFL